MSIFEILGIVGGLGGAGLGAAIAFIPGAAAVAGKVVGGALEFASKLPVWVWVIVTAALVTTWALYSKHEQASKDAKTIAGWQHKAEDSHHAFLLEKGQFAIEKSSLDQARGIINENNRRILAGAADLDRAKQDAAAADARNAKLAQSTDARIAGLQAASHQHTKPCVLSDAAKQELGNQ